VRIPPLTFRLTSGSGSPGNGSAAGAVPVITSRRLAIRPAHPSDYPFLYSLECHPQLRYRWSSDRHLPTFEMFVQRLSFDPARQFVALDREARPIGWVEAYNEDPSQAFAWLGVFMQDDAQGSGFGIEAISLFIHYLFCFRPYRKLYAYVTEPSFSTFKSGAGRYFHVEGVLRDHEYYHGALHDRIILAVYASEWRDLMKRWGPRIGCSLELSN